ncbi:MAG: alpha/beta hydrolase [Burkholderiales bacterium]|nr:MAG: alpha/beta hydrolase [Burkholderiales bacterium]
MGDGSQSQADLVLLPDNPPPQGAEVIWYEGRGGHRLRMLYAPEPKDNGVKTRGLAIVCPGRSEFIEKYFEVARDLQDRGFAVVIFDWPGQGLSQRPLKNALAGHVKSFDWYVDALMRGLAKIERRVPKTWVIVAHSMGGTIAMKALSERRLTVAAAAFSAPMWGIPIWFFQRWYGRSMRVFGAGAVQARPPQPDETFENNQLTHYEPRWQLFRRLIEAEPKLALGEPTIAWVVASLNAFKELFAPNALNAVQDVPMLVAIASEETIVKKSAQRKLGNRLKSAKIINVQGAGHEILMETDERRDQFWKAFEDMCKRARV